MNPSAPQLAPLVVVAGPSGVGKTTVATQAIEKIGPRLRRAITATTRGQRPGETPDDYHYWTVEKFTQERDAGRMLEWAQVFGKDYYGTPKSEVECLAQGTGVVLVIDVQGAASVRKLYPDCLTVFIDPPSLEVLEARLRSRQDTTEEKILRRLEEARREMARKGEFRHVIVNRDLPDAVRELEQLIRAEFHKYQQGGNPCSTS